MHCSPPVTLSTFEQKEMSLPGPSNAAQSTHMIRTKRELEHYTTLLLARCLCSVAPTANEVGSTTRRVAVASSVELGSAQKRGAMS